MVADDESWAGYAGLKEGGTLLLVAASRPTAAEMAPTTADSAAGCCERCGSAARAAPGMVWWGVVNLFPLLFSFVWTMFDSSGGA